MWPNPQFFVDLVTFTEKILFSTSELSKTKKLTIDFNNFLWCWFLSHVISHYALINSFSCTRNFVQYINTTVFSNKLFIVFIPWICNRFCSNSYTGECYGLSFVCCWRWENKKHWAIQIYKQKSTHAKAEIFVSQEKARDVLEPRKTSMM